MKNPPEWNPEGFRGADGGPRGLFWLSWVIGGLLYGISSVIIEAVKTSRSRHDDDIIV